MACDKVYGLRRLFLAKQTNGETGTFYETRATAIELPKIFTEQVVVDENLGVRGDSATVDGNLNELTGTITMTLPKDKANFINHGGVQALFHGAGFSVSTNAITPLNTGACATTFAIYTLDRTGILAERLDGCILTSIDFTFNKSDPPSVSFAFQASRKLEFWKQEEISAFTNDDATVSTQEIGQFNAGGFEISDIGAGVMPITLSDGSDTETGAYIDGYNPSTGYCTIKRANPVAFDGDVTVAPAVPAGAVIISSNISYASNRAWSMTQPNGDADLKIQSVTLNIATGMSYGEMLMGQKYLSEVLVGTLEATGSMTVYIDSAAHWVSGNLRTTSGIEITIGDYKIVLPQVQLTEPPDMALAKNEPASGDFAFRGLCYDGLDLVSFTNA